MIAVRPALLVLLACLAACAFTGVATAQSPTTSTTSSTTTSTPEPQAVEPQVGTAAPVQPGATPVPVEPVPVPTTTATATAGGTETVIVTAGGTPATTDSGNSGVPWETIAFVTLGALLLFVLIVLALWRVRGWDPRWLQRWRHAMAEAGWRLSLGWAEFRDFVRLGR